MFQAVQFPTGVAHLNASLADMDWNTFPHDEFWKKGFDTSLRQEFSESNEIQSWVLAQPRNISKLRMLKVT